LVTTVCARMIVQRRLPIMTPLEIIRRAQAGTLIDEDGNAVTLELFPGLSDTDLQDFANRLPCRIPPEIAELLSACRGFYGTVELVDFTGRDLMFEFEQVFPDGLPIAADGYGNFWVVDLHPDTTRWGPIYFACHDAPVILHQADSLEQFLSELFRMFEPPHQSLIDDVHEDRLAHVWRTNPGVLSYEQCLESEDPILSAFARELGHSFQIIDLRLAKPGDGFSWGRYGPRTQIRRFRTYAVFAYEKPKSVISRLFGREV
jgi:cell wall assembly regulator SMI1